MKKYKFKTKLKEAFLIKRQERPVPVSIFMDGEEMQVICLGMGGVRDGEYACLVAPDRNLISQGLIPRSSAAGSFIGNGAVCR